METIKDDVELYSYHISAGVFKGRTFYVFKSGSISSYTYIPAMGIRDIKVKNSYEGLKGELRYLKTIPATQLKMMLTIKPDL